MNLRFYSIAILMSAIPHLTLAESRVSSLNKGDFIAAERLSPSGDTVLKVKLSKSGKAKLKRLQRQLTEK